MNNTIKTPKLCFSYIRFSSNSQKDGSSLDRQSEIAPRVAKEKGWTLREDLNAQDLGVSAFKGDNFKTLESIHQSVLNGKIPQGSVMIVEAFDRFSRMELDTAEDLLKKLLRVGLEVFVYRGGHHLTKESLNKPIDRIIALLELAAANEYSEKLSQRLKKSYEFKNQKILNGERVKINNLPSWVNDDFKLNGHAEIIRGIFTMYLNGKGPGAIARELNQTKVSTATGKGTWGQGYIYRLLSNRQVIGEYRIGDEVVKG